MWICVSDDFNVNRLLKEMLQFTQTMCNLTNTDAVANMLQPELKGKKLLLVLDDVWEDNQGLWDSFKDILLGFDLRGCVMLITTRRNDVVVKARALKHDLPDLSEEEGWDLLKKRVFSEPSQCDSHFEDVGRRIVRKCKGNPLAIKAIAGILQSKKLPKEWESIHNSELWHLELGDTIEILPSLLLSYNHLDDVYVKQCFAYCAIFPKDFKMEKQQLITLWLAQGFLRDDSAASSSTSTLESVAGENYFNTLLNHSFLDEEIDFLDRKWYKMHDLVHDLAAYILKKDLLVWKVGENPENNDVSHVRHLVFNLSKNEKPSESFTRRLWVTKLRTISFRDDVWINYTTLSSARYMRTLIMADTGLKEVPSIIGQLVHLRYLDLSDNPEIDVLPDSICRLYQLQTLRIVGCDKLMKLPTELYRLENLRHIEAGSYMWASRRLGELTNLQTLPSLELRDGEGWTIDELGPLDQLKGNVSISGLEHVKNSEAAKQASLGMKKNIVELWLEWGTISEANNNDEDVLNCLEPHQNLQSLFVSGFRGVNFPPWIMKMAVNQGPYSTSLENLTEVDISDCRRCQHLPTLGQLPILQRLQLQVLDDLKGIGDGFYQTSSSDNSDASDLTSVTAEKATEFFPSLKKLEILRCKSLDTWNSPSQKQGAILFPNLESLRITDCPQLEEVPCLKLHSLKELILSNLGGTQPLNIIKYSHALTSLLVSEMEKMTKLPQELSSCTNLETLYISDCVNMKWIPSGLISLKRLYIHECPSLACIPDGLSFLQELNIRGCSSLACIPDGLSFLQQLHIEECPSLACIPDGLSFLQQLDIWRCPSLACIPDGLRSVQNLSVEVCEGLERMPKSLEESTSLEELIINNCPSIKGPIPDLGRLHGLKELTSLNSGELRACCLQWIPHLHHLQRLEIDGNSRGEWDFNITFPQSLTVLILRDFQNVKSLPQQLFPSTLQSLTIERFDDLERLPDWFSNLSCLRRLELSNCKKLKYLPSTLSKLQELWIDNCPLLKERCNKLDGPEWHKISHIPRVEFE